MKTIGIYIFDGMTMLDALMPQQVFGFVPDFEVVMVARSTDPVVTDTKVRILPDHDLESCPPVDILVVPGGIDVLTEMRDEAVMAWIRSAGESAEYVTSVCTGALMLAEAGLLDGFKATTHWAYTDALATYPEVELTDGRVVHDRTRITAGGVTAGIDFALTLVAELVSPDLAAALTLMAQYDPEPPLPVGNPANAPAELVAAVRAQFEGMAPDLNELYAARAAAVS